MNEHKELGVIERTELGFERGVLTFMIDFDFGGEGQGFGGYCLNYKATCKNEVPKAISCIEGILKAVGANDWEHLVGKQVWVTRDKNNFKIVEIEAPKFIPHGKPFNIVNHFDDGGVE